MSKTWYLLILFRFLEHSSDTQPLVCLQSALCVVMDVLYSPASQQFPRLGFRCMPMRNIHKSEKEILNTQVLGYTPKKEVEVMKNGGCVYVHGCMWTGVSVEYTFSLAMQAAEYEYCSSRCKKLSVDIIKHGNTQGGQWGKNSDNKILFSAFVALLHWEKECHQKITLPEHW